jgi:hypothetical protein
MDSRDYAAMTGGDQDWKFQLYVEAPEGAFSPAGDYDEVIDLPTHWEVCPLCEGKGTHVNPSIDAHGLTAEDFYEDPDFAEDYVSGLYDQACNECHGRTTVRAVDWDAVSKEHQQMYRQQLDDIDACNMQSYSERMMGA